MPLLPNQVHPNGTLDTAPPRVDGQPPQPPQEPPKSPPQQPPGSHRVIALIAAVGALSVVVLALAAILILGNSHSSAKNTASQTASAIYQQKLSAALGPLVSANQALSSALAAIDGSPHSITAAQNATTQAQGAVASVNGAIAALPVPVSETTLQQQTQQALTQETGYLQGVSGTLSDPIGQSSSSLRTLATNTQTAFVSIASVAPGASTSISGTDNLLAWVSGANAAANAAAKKAQQPIVINHTTTVVQPPPYEGPSVLRAPGAVRQHQRIRRNLLHLRQQHLLRILAGVRGRPDPIGDDQCLECGRSDVLHAWLQSDRRRHRLHGRQWRGCEIQPGCDRWLL